MNNKMKTIGLIFILLLVHQVSFGQQDSALRKSKYDRSLNSSSKKLIKAITENKSNEEIAADYFLLAQKLIKKGDYEKAETYLQKAIFHEKQDKKGTNLGNYYRELAKVQEQLKRKEDAANSFGYAAKYARNDTIKQINENDASRLEQGVTPSKELEFLDKKAVILSNTNEKQERVKNFTQMADANIKLNEPEKALNNYTKALNELDKESEESNEIKSNMAIVLANKKQFKEAISLQKEVVEKSSNVSEVEVQVQQLRKLSGYYFADNNNTEGLKALYNAYKLAMQKGNLKEAKTTLESLANFYKKNKQDNEALMLYKQFLNNLDSLIAKDSNLVDVKLFQFSEEKIAQLEKEQALMNELIQRKNSNNTLLLISVLLLVSLLLIIVKSFYSIKKRNKKIALQSLRREMNPHFIFNSLNSVNQFIANNNELAANKYLTSYSNLMRRMMESSNNDYISLALEIEQINKYLELEQLRFPDKLQYQIVVDPEMDTEMVKVPNMVIQPNLENAIWHGLRYKDKGGLLIITFSKEGTKNKVVIDDNGIGLKESERIKTNNQKLYESRGLKNVRERIHLLNEIGHKTIRMNIHEKTLPETGVLVTIIW